MKRSKAPVCISGRFTLMFVTAVFMLLCSCGQKASYTLDTFNEFPTDIGCSCSFGETEKNFKNGNYIFGSDFDSVAYISVNSQMVKLKLTGTNRNDTLNDDRTDTFSNDEFRVIVTPKKIRNSWEETETIRYQGRMKIQKNGDEVIEKKFVGECGC